MKKYRIKDDTGIEFIQNVIHPEHPSRHAQRVETVRQLALAARARGYVRQAAARRHR